MKDRIERFVVLPFSLGCSTQSSIAVVATHQFKNQHKLIKPKEGSDENRSVKEEEEEESSLHKESNIGNISDGIYKLIRSLKTFSHFFIRYKEERKERDEEMSIGFPTDVKHITHIGVDGTMTTFDTSSSLSVPVFQLTAN